MKASYLDGRVVVLAGEKYQYFYGTSYLGLPYDVDFQKLLQEGQQKYGSSLGSSPMSTPQLDVYASLESVLALKYGFEDAIVFASGYAAGQAVMNLFYQQDYNIEYGNVAHPALKLERKITERTKENNSKRIIYAVDYIDPISFEKYNLNIKNNEGDRILIDASHGLGLFDEDIRSFAKSESIIVSGSLNKALGINAGVLLCTSALKKQVTNTLRYKTASAPSPSECFALLKALESNLIQNKQDHLRKIISNLDAGYLITMVADFPVLTFKDNREELYGHLKDNKILIWRNRYPKHDSPMVNRAVVTAAHSLTDVDSLMETIYLFNK